MNTGVEINTDFYFVQWMFLFTSPRLKVSGAEPIKLRWGKNFIPLKPGSYMLEVSVRYGFANRFPNSIYVQINEGDFIQLNYHTPFTIFSTASLVQINNLNQLNSGSNQASSTTMYNNTVQKSNQPFSKVSPNLPPVPSKKEYYLVLSDEQAGPFNIEKLKLLIEIKQLTQDTLIWTKGLDDWKPASHYPEILDLFNKY